MAQNYEGLKKHESQTRHENKLHQPRMNAHPGWRSTWVAQNKFLSGTKMVPPQANSPVFLIPELTLWELAWEIQQ